MKTYEVEFTELHKKKLYIYDGEELKVKDQVIVETENGQEYGIIIKVIDKLSDTDDVLNIIRKVEKEDLEIIEKNEQDAKEALEEAKKLAKKYELSMNFLNAHYSFDRKQLLFNFIAEARVDFRELARALAGIYKTRIELHQIGIRDKAKEIGGIGQCGRCLCCKNFLDHVGSISINMVKNQNIAINPAKINGQCGRLLCCLTYEDEEYTRCQQGMPQVGDIVTTEYGEGKVISTDILKRTYKVDIDGNKKEIRLSCENCPK